MLGNHILFTSRGFDAETGLYYNRARYLDPTTGRWTTQDPLGFAAGDANLYRYVGNMATMATDPSGNIAFVPFVVAGAIAGWWLLGPGAGTAHAPSPGQENFRTPPRPLAEDVLAGISGAIAGGGAALAGEAAVVAGGPILRRLRPGVGSATTNPVTQVGEGIRNWLGPGARVVRNDARGFVILSRDGLRRFRMDFAGPGTPPAHAHLEVWDPVSRRWVDAIPGQHRIPFRGD